MGRFGNSLLQYTFLRTYARRYDLEVQTPRWIGQQLFGFRDARIKQRLPTVREKDEHGRRDTIIPHLEGALCDANVEGYFQYHTSWYAPDKAFIRSLFQPVPALQAQLQPALDRLRGLGKTLVGIHLRRGDYGRGMFYITPTSWYLTWLARTWETLDQPVLFIATESPELVQEFAAYRPQTVETLGVKLDASLLAGYNQLPYDKAHPSPQSLLFFADWYLLTRCHALAIPNSSFSFVASMLADELRFAVRSIPSLQDMALYDPWDDMPSQYVKQADYEHIPGLYLADNKYWS